MRSVFKYPLGVADEQFVSMPDGAQILHFAEQHGTFCLWALLDPDAPTTGLRRVRIAGTGHEIKTDPDKLRFIGSTLMHDGNFVFHAFEVLP